MAEIQSNNRFGIKEIGAYFMVAPILFALY